MKKRAFDLNLISQYRTPLMGIAMLMVLLCHAKMNKAPFPEIVLNFLKWGNWGVDIFFLLSGVGIYYSLSKLDASDGNLIKWYYARFKRILIPYLILEIPYWLVHCYIKELSIGHFFYYISMISYWTEHVAPWFLAILLPLYLMSPFLYKLFKGPHKYWLASILVFICLLSAKFPYQTWIGYSDIIHNIQFGLIKVPCFIIGLVFGKDIMNHKNINLYLIISSSFILVLWMIFFPSFHMGRGLIAASILCILFVHIFQQYPSIVRFFFYIGVATLEIYVTLDVVVKSFVLVKFPMGGAFFIYSVLLALIFGVSFHYFINGICKSFRICK